MKVWERKRRLVVLALAFALLASLSLLSGSGLATVQQEMLTNGDFESGFSFVSGCGNVGNGWGCFTNGGSVTYGFYDDQWAPVVAGGAHSQLIELNTKGYGATQNDRYAGIYQRTKLVKGEQYTFSMKGVIREDTPDARDDPFRYRVQWGYTTGSTDWTTVSNWEELPWDKIDTRLNPTGIMSFSTSFVAPADQVTIFVRVWKKWGATQKELDVNIDSISVWGRQISKPCRDCQPAPMRSPKPGTQPAPVAACGGANLVKNGNFEGGFVTVPGWGEVGKGWTAFQNGGALTHYSFYDEQWPPVVKSPKHDQLIEINTKGSAAGDSDRVAGIMQVVTGLKKGATYQFSLYGEMREEAAHPDEDKFRYRVQWGYAMGGTADVGLITNWQELPWDKIYVRTSPGAMSHFSGKFVAPSDKIVLAVRAWKKWPTAQRELDVNLDDISIQACGRATMPAPHEEPPVPGKGACQSYIVRSGDTLYKIAFKFGDSMEDLAVRNEIANANVIRVGQKLAVCNLKW